MTGMGIFINKKLWPLASHFNQFFGLNKWIIVAMAVYEELCARRMPNNSSRSEERSILICNNSSIIGANKGAARL